MSNHNSLVALPISPRFALSIGKPKTAAETEKRFFLRARLKAADVSLIKSILADNPTIDARLVIGRVTLSETEIFLSFPIF